MRESLKEILQVTEKDYQDLNEIVWGRSERGIHSLLCVPGSEDVVNTAVQWDEVDISKTQLKRVRWQAQTMLLWLELRVQQVRKQLAHFNENKTDTLRDFYAKYPTATKKALMITVCKTARICVKVFRKWRNQFFTQGGKFTHDERGLAQFSWILVNEDKKHDFTAWLKCQRNLNVLMATEYVNHTLLAECPLGHLDNWGRLRRPCQPSTVHRWMLYCGCSYEEATKSYLTDSHERHGTLLDRIWNCSLDYFLSLRMHRWICLPKSVVEKLKLIHTDWPPDTLAHTIPVEDVGQFPPGLYYAPKQVPPLTVCTHCSMYSLYSRCWHCRLRCVR